MASFPTPAGGADTGPGGAMTPPDRAPKTSGQASGQTSGRSRLARFLSLRFPVFLALASLTCFALPQQAAAQTATVSLSPLSPSVAEGGTFTFTATLSASVSEAVTVRWTATDGTATVSGAGSDLASGQAATGTVTFPADSAANATQTFTIATNNDDLVEGSETFTVTLDEDTAGGNPLPTGVEIGDDDEAAATITDNDLATVTRFPGTASLFEGTTFSFEVRLNRAVSKPVTVRWTATATGDNPATLEGAGSDLASGQTTTGTVTFQAGSTTTQTFDIATLNDTVVEGDETFTVSIAADDDNPLPDGVSIDRNDTTAATIIDNDPAFVTRFPATAERIEGGTINFQVRLNRAVPKPVTVRWTATATGTGDGHATLEGAGSDLADGQRLTGTVTFPAGNNTTQTIGIATRDDGVIEGDETFTVTYDEDPDNPLPGGVTYLGSDTAEATIVDNDTATVSLSPLSPSAAEGGTFTFTATLSASVPEAVTVRWTAASGTATVSGAGSDLASGQATTGTVTFQANGAANATQTFTIATNNDTRVEGSETFTVTLGEDTQGGNALPTGVEIGDDDEAEATIADNDGAVTLSPLSPSAAEGGTFTFTATLSASVSEAVTVRWTATATGDNPATVTAGANADLGTGQAATGTVTFPADSAANATQTFTIVTADDDRVEGSETFTVSLGADDDNPLPDGITVGDDNEATATITDRDVARVSLFPLSPPVVEGGMFTFTVRLNRTVTTAPVTVRWTATATGTGDGHATLEGAGSDLASGQVLTGTVEFPANSAVDARRTFTIATNNDTLVEGSETFTVTLSADPDNPLPDRVSIGDADEAAATITEGDRATVTIFPGTALFPEGSTFSFQVRMSAAVAKPVTVRWTATATGDNAATLTGAGSDLASGQATTGTVTFPAGSTTTQTFDIVTLNDAVVEGDETFTVTFDEDPDNPLPDGVSISNDDTTAVTIDENDFAFVEGYPGTATWFEGTTFSFEVRMNRAVSKPVTVRWTATTTGTGDGHATLTGPNSDLASGQATTGTVTFLPGDNTTQTFDIATRDDAVVWIDETFTVTFDADPDNPLPDGVSISNAHDTTAATIREDDAAVVILSPLSPSAAEGGTFTFTATLNASVASPVTVRWAAGAITAPGGATLKGAGSDLASGQATTATVTFPANSAANATQTFTIATNNDDLVEGSETFKVSILADDDTALPYKVTVGDTVGSGDRATVTITDDDAATVSLSPLSPSEAEGGTFTFTATLSAAVSSPVTVRWTAASGTAPGDATLEGSGSDLASGQATTATVVFPADSAANATQTFTIATNNDDLVEGSETFTVSLAADSSTPLPDGVTVGSADEATATITETDAATVSLSPLSPSVAEGGTFTFTATLSAAVSEAVTVRWTATSGTATVTGAGSDLASGQATTATVTFPANSAANATQTFTIATANDDLVEGSETFTVSLAADSSTPLPDGVTVGSADEATATITETDAATVTLSPLSPSVAEGGTFTFTATLSAAVSEPVTVRWTAASGTATLSGAGSDLGSGQATTATVTFPADSAANATQTFTIATNNDDLVEGSETFTVSIAADSSTPLPDGVEISADDEATATITEDDAATVSLSPLSPSVAEGGTFTFTATLSAAVSESVTVRWTAASGTATVTGAGSDLASGQATTATVVFPADSAANATQTFTIATNNDDLVEGSETFTVSLAADSSTPLPDGVTVGSADEATATITETDAATVSLSPLSPSVAEGGTFTFTATLSATVSEPVTVRWTATDGTATVTGAGSDLASGQATTATVVFPADSAANATQTFTIATNNDDLVEGSETFTVSIAADPAAPLPDGVTIGSADEATATITETDAATVTLSPLSPSVAEGGTFTFTATLSAAVSEPVTVRWTATSGTATVTGAGSDLTANHDVTGTVVFPADSAANATQTFTIATANDARVEGSETFTVTLGEDTEGGNDLPDGVEIGSADEATATITETDAATVSLSPLSPSVAEGGTFTFTATLSASVSEAVTVRWTATSGTATVSGAGSDLTANHDVTATVVFPADSAANATQTFTIATRDDAVAEGSETFTVSIAADTAAPLPDGVEIGAADEATATITDEAAVVSLSPSASSRAEGGTFTFTVALSTAVSAPVTVRWTATSGRAPGDATLSGPNSDLASGQATGGTVIFLANSTASRTFTIATRNDTVAEGSETFTVTIDEDPDNALPPGVSIGAADEARATITDGVDAATVTLSPSSSSRAEGRTFSFTVTLNGSSSSPVTVRWRARASGDNPATLEGANSDLADGQAIGGRVVTFPANSPPGSRREIDIATRDDAVAEGDETFTVDLLEDPARPLPTGVIIGDADESAATITDDDEAPVVNASVSIDDASVAENGGNAEFTVRLSRAVDSAVTLAVAYAAGTASLTDDLGARPATVTIDRGQTEATLLVPVIDDEIVEGDEDFTVTVSEGDTPLPDGVTIGTDNMATGTIEDDDEAEVTLSPLSPSEAEGGTFTFTVALNRAVSQAVTVRWTATSGTAPGDATLDGAGSDLASGQATGGAVTFLANSTASQTFTIATRNDTVAEGDETFTVRIAADPDNALPPGVSIGDADEAAATITDAADAATVSLSPSDPSRAEGGTFTFTVALNRAVSQAVTVRWTARASGDNPATLSGAGSDLASGQATGGAVTFPANSTAPQTFTIATRDDAVAEGAETFAVRIAADPAAPLPPGVSIGDADEASATITDAADAATVSLSPLSPSAAEGGTFTFTVALNRTVSQAVTVRWTARASGDNPATLEGAGSDLASGQAATGSVIFPADSAADAPQEFTIATVDDARVEGSETFTVTLAEDIDAPLPPGVTVGDDNQATATITEDDGKPEPSILIEPRRIGAGAALRRHVDRFDSLTGALVRSRLAGCTTRRLSASENLGRGAAATGGRFGETGWCGWLDGAWAGFDGKATGRQADIYGGVDYRSGSGSSGGDWLIGALIGYERADLEIGKATYSADYIHFGLYGGARLSERLLFDAAATYGLAAGGGPTVALGGVSASYDAWRLTVRAGLTGDIGLEYGLWNGTVRIEPRVGVLYARETLGAFTDSAGGVAGREVLELGRFSAGPRLTWDFAGDFAGRFIGGQLVVGGRAQWDFLRLEDGVGGRVSGAADIGLRLVLAPGVALGLYGNIDGIGTVRDFISYGGRVQLDIRF